MTGPAKTGNLGTNYIPSPKRLYLSTAILYLHSLAKFCVPTCPVFTGPVTYMCGGFIIGGIFIIIQLIHNFSKIMLL